MRSYQLQKNRQSTLPPAKATPKGMLTIQVRKTASSPVSSKPFYPINTIDLLVILWIEDLINHDHLRILQ